MEKVETTIQELDVEQVRKDFPNLHRQVNGRPWVYLDNGATSQKPNVVIDAISNYYRTYNSNVHRGVHQVSQEATQALEDSRKAVQKFLNASQAEEIIFTSGTTGAINLVASSFGKAFIQEGDEIIISELEHHSNIVPWQMVCQEKKAILKVIPVNGHGELVIEEFEKLLSKRTRIVSIAHVSNTLGTINPVSDIIEKAHKWNVPVLLDGAQAAPHLKIDVQELDCDFYCFSSHKAFGPTGVGVLYGKRHWLEKIPPYQGGGEMIKTVTFEKTEYNEVPFKFEAGTPNIADNIALKAALEYITELGHDTILSHEKDLLRYAVERLSEIDGVRFIGTAKNKVCVISFLLEGIHPYDVGVILDKLGIAVRTGHHCTEPLMNKFGIPGTVRASFAMYNTKEEVDKLVEGVLKAREMLS